MGEPDNSDYALGHPRRFAVPSLSRSLCHRGGSPTYSEHGRPARRGSPCRLRAATGLDQRNPSPELIVAIWCCHHGGSPTYSEHGKRLAETAMNPSEEFRKHAAECKRMAQSARKREDKKVWIQMADRWLVCAKLAEDQYSAALFRSEEHSPKHRIPAPQWAHWAH